MSRKVPFTYTITFAAIPAGGQSNGNVLVESNAPFVVERQRAVFWNDSIFGGAAIARTPLAGIGGNYATENTYPNHYMIHAMLKDNLDQWTKAMTSLPLLFDIGEVDRPLITQREVGAGNTIYAEVINYTSISLSGQLAFMGYKIVP